MKVFYKQNSYVHLNFVSQIRDANEINRMNESITNKIQRKLEEKMAVLAMKKKYYFDHKDDADMIHPAHLKPIKKDWDDDMIHNKWRQERDIRDEISKNWLDPRDYSRDIVAKNIIVFYDYKDTFKEVAIWKFGTEEEMNKVYKILADKLKQTTEEIIIT